MQQMIELQKDDIRNLKIKLFQAHQQHEEELK